MVTVEIFRALGDSTRLKMIERLSSGDAFTISSISSGLDISRQGARKHLQILADADLVTLETKGRDTHVHLDRATLEKGKIFIAELEHRWDMRLLALRDFVDKD